MFEDKAGTKVPDVTFRIREDHSWVYRTTYDFFRYKRVIVFALPGAFNPVCSSIYLPAYNDLYDTFRASGIDDIYCLAMNDGFVLEAWRQAEKAEKITMLPDVDGEFTKKLGFLSGDHSWRYSMIVNDKVIEKMFIETDADSVDPYSLSSAEMMLSYLDPKAVLPESVTIFTKHGCGNCEAVKEYFNNLNIPFDELILNEDFTIRTVRAISGSTFLPQIFVNGIKTSLDELQKRDSKGHSGTSHQLQM